MRRTSGAVSIPCRASRAVTLLTDIVAQVVKLHLAGIVELDELKVARGESRQWNGLRKCGLASGNASREYRAECRFL